MNNEIVNSFNSVVNLRVGGEARYGVFSVRGGVGYSMSPYQDISEETTNGQTTASFGIGLREKSVFIDLGITRGMFNETYTPYTVPGATQNPTVENSISKTQFVGTIGFRF